MSNEKQNYADCLDNLEAARDALENVELSDFQDTAWIDRINELGEEIFVRYEK